MNSTLVNKENNVVTFTMEFTADELETATDTVYKRNRGKFRIDGFRQGKAPRSIIERKYGAGIFYEEAIDDLLNKEYPNALDALDIEPIARPNLDFGDDKIEKDKGFKVTLKVETVPEVEVKNYKGMKVERTVHTVSDEDVQKQLEMLQKRNARQVIAEDEAVVGDTVILDYTGFCEDEQFEGGTAENQSLKLGSATFIPGFEEQLVGVKPGEERDINMTFPAEYHAEKLAGKDAVFKCKVHEIKREELPVLDDEFAKDVSEFDTLEELKADQKRKLEESAGKAKEYSGKNAVVEKLLELNPFEAPEAMIENEALNMLDEYAQQLKSQGIDLQLFLNYTGKTEEDLKNDMRPDAEKRVKSRLALKAVERLEGIEATDEEIEAEYEKMAEQYKMEVEKLKELFGKDNSKLLREDIVNNKTIQMLYDNAVFTDKERDDNKPEA
jgi:trigger factor